MIFTHAKRFHIVSDIWLRVVYLFKTMPLGIAVSSWLYWQSWTEKTISYHLNIIKTNEYFFIAPQNAISVYLALISCNVKASSVAVLHIINFYEIHLYFAWLIDS